MLLIKIIASKKVQEHTVGNRKKRDWESSKLFEKLNRSLFQIILFPTAWVSYLIPISLEEQNKKAIGLAWLGMFFPQFLLYNY